jgi:hypothetical protein
MPELQDPASFADGILHIAEAHRKVARLYMEDGGYEAACPPLRAVLSIMAYGNYEVKEIDHPEVRDLFTRESLISRDWYGRRLKAKQRRDIHHWKELLRQVGDYMDAASVQDFIGELDLPGRLKSVRDRLAEAEAPTYLESLEGTIGVDPFQPDMKDKLMVDRLAEVSSS